MMIGAVLVVALSAGVIGMSLMERSRRSLKTGAWSRDHLGLRLLAESAADELHLRTLKAVNAPSDPVFTSIRAIPTGDPWAPAPLAAGAPSAAAACKAVLERELGGPITLTHSVQVRRLSKVSPDPIERCGIIRYETAARLDSGRRVTIERVRTERSFRIARVTPPRPLDQVGLFVGSTGGAMFRGLREGTPVFAGARSGPRSLLEMITSEDIVPVPDATRGELARAINQLSPGALSLRAHYVTSSAAELGRLFSARLRRNQPVNGVIHNLSQEEIELQFPSFAGKCLISTSGPVRVGDIRLADPARDSLTIVSRQRIVVVGRTVEAVLVNFADRKEGVVFANRTSIKGAVLTSRFPAGLSLSGADYELCRIEHAATLDSGDAPDAAPDDRLLSHYIAAFSPHPVSLEHRRDREEWSAW
jgi:hypothetical protein